MKNLIFVLFIFLNFTASAQVTIESYSEGLMKTRSQCGLIQTIQLGGSPKIIAGGSGPGPISMLGGRDGEQRGRNECSVVCTLQGPYVFVISDALGQILSTGEGRTGDEAADAGKVKCVLKYPGVWDKVCQQGPSGLFLKTVSYAGAPPTAAPPTQSSNSPPYDMTSLQNKFRDARPPTDDLSFPYKVLSCKSQATSKYIDGQTKIQNIAFEKTESGKIQMYVPGTKIKSSDGFPFEKIDGHWLNRSITREDPKDDKSAPIYVEYTFLRIGSDGNVLLERAAGLNPDWYPKAQSADGLFAFAYTECIAE